MAEYMGKHQLKIITSTTRPGRKGAAVAKWMTKLCKEADYFESELLDLAEIQLPFMDETDHPFLRQYQRVHTREWSATIDAADAFLIILAEYNFGFPAPIKNALDYLYHEWKHKPVAILSYGGISGGLRSTQMLKQVLAALNMIPLAGSIAVPSFEKYISEDDVFLPGENLVTQAQSMLSELHSWTEILRTMRIQEHAGSLSQ